MSPVVVVAVVAALASASADAPREIDGSRTIHGAEVSARPNPIPARYVYGADRDWTLRPYRLAAVLVEFQDRRHEDVHTAAMYDRMLFSRDEYHETPGGDVSFGSLADWYRVQSHDDFVLTGRVFDWVMVDETFEAVHGLKLKDAQKRYLRTALAKVRARDGANVLDEFDGFLFVHVGPITGPPGNIFWSHRANVEGRRYVTTGEIERIGVLCHEFGHTLGLPDLYPKKGEREGFGPWCAMAGGYRGKYPKSFCAWSKTRLGWCRPIVVDAATPQKLVLRPIQTHPDDAVLVPLNATDGVGAEFLLLENRAAAGNDAEGQPGLFIWRITRRPDSGGFPHFELKLPGPEDDKNANRATRRVAWPSASARDFVIPRTADSFSAAIRNIQMSGDLVSFELGPDER
jgi:M6 family metalloprotease-like protein